MNWKKVKKKNNFPEVPAHRKVVIAALGVKGLPTVMFTVGKYARGWGKTYKTYDAAVIGSPHVSLWR